MNRRPQWEPQGPSVPASPAGDRARNSLESSWHSPDRLLEAIEQATAETLHDHPADAAMLELLRRMMGQASAPLARSRAAEWLAEYLGASGVTLVHGTLPAMDQQVAVGVANDSASLRAAIQVACCESIALGRCLIASTSPTTSDPSLAHRPLSSQLVQQNPAASQHCILTMPLLTERDLIVGALQVIWCGQAVIPDSEQAFLLRLQPLLAETIAALDRGEKSRWAERLGHWRRFITSRRAQWIGVVLGVLVALGCLPVSYPVGSKVTLWPQQQRVITAPFAGPLQQVHVAAGDTVRAGDQLCSLDEEDLQTQLAAYQAESRRIQAERAGHQAAGRFGEAELARLQALKTTAEMDRLEHHLHRAAICSPIDGVVLGDDLQQLSGAPLEVGQSLMEIAPLDKLVARLEIPPDQISHVQAGQQVTLRMEATGRLEGLTIQRVAPRGERNEDGTYTFTARVIVDNSAARFKPGMQGTANIATDRMPLAWAAFQRLWQKVRSWI